jgi:hypothetical protein
MNLLDHRLATIRQIRTLPFGCLNSSNCGGGFRPLNQFHDDEGECDQDRAFRSFEAASVVGLFYAPPYHRIPSIQDRLCDPAALAG